MPPDTRIARSAFVTLFLILAAQSLIETARDTLFLSRLPLKQLPLMYLAVALASILVARTAASLAAWGVRSLLPALLAGSAGVTAVFYGVAGSRSPAFLYVLYVWPSVFASVVLVEFWRTVSDAYTITEAKQLFGRLGAGGTAGAAAGSAAAVALSVRFPAAGLLLMAAVVMIAAVPLSRALPAPAAPLTPTPEPAAAAAVRTIGTNAYLRGVAVCLFLATAMATLTDFLFKAVVTRSVPPDHIATVFSGTTFAINVGALALQLTLVGPLIQRFGVTRSLTVLPAALALAAAGVAASAGVLGAAAARVTDGTLRYSLHRAISDLLYVPLNPALRGRIKNLIDVLSQRVGQVMASVAILVVLQFGGGHRTVGIGIVLLATIMIVIAVRLTQPYLDLFRSTLRKAGTETRLALPDLDLQSLRSLVAAFSGADERAVIAALELAADQSAIDVIPVVMLFHPSTAVVLRVLELFEQHRRGEFVWALDRLRRDATDPQVKAAALRACARHREDPSLLWTALDSGNDAVTMTALAELVAGGWLAGDAAARRLADATAGTSAAAQESLAIAIRNRPLPVFEDTLWRLAGHDDRRVRLRAAEAIGRMPGPRLLPVLRTMLADSMLRPVVREAFVLRGRPALEFLAASLEDETLPKTVRLHLPRSISRFDAAEAIPLLWRRLTREPDDVIKLKLLSGIGHLVTETPHTRPSREAIDHAIAHASRIGLRFATWRTGMVREPLPESLPESGALLERILDEKRGQAVEAVFRLLKIASPEEDFERIYRGVCGNRTERASGRELLESLLRGSTRATVLAMLDDPAPETIRPSTRAYTRVLAEIVSESTGVLHAVASRHAADIGVVSATGR